MKILCNAEDCIYNKPDKDENNSYHRKCVHKTVEIWRDKLVSVPLCFSFEIKE